ncbi:hypothetical protein CHS0354_039831 [Potamilus streckersoni]|uniref:Cadherin domain-containing protein n=1 Tax=Potamilus streckersoni TaxID=2493646 RepID=A0AAE0SRI0_9BIVA|nr:hypothetical protein CHS0354_039831 [Potamilus streckersoni]
MASGDHSNIFKATTIFFIVNALCGCTRSQDILYSIDEEQPKNTTIGTISKDYDLRSTMTTEEYQNLVYKILMQGNPYAFYFDINNRTSVLYTAAVIDREKLSHCTYSPKCVLPIDIAIQTTSSGFFRKLKIDVIVKDINDNDPHFAATQETIAFSEASVIGSSATIQGALDIDAGNFSVQSYRILPQDSPFSVRFEKYVDGSSMVIIVLKQELDREKREFYSITVVAEDGGIPTRTGTILVNVTVIDVNDNPPEFMQRIYNVTVKEDVDINTTIIILSATDKDVGLNGEIKYGLSPIQSQDVLKLFELDSRTGELRVIGQLVYTPNQSLRIIVEASDKVEKSLISQAEVYVNILDSNNNAPVININILSGTVSEYVNVGTVVAHISVTDDDTGRDGIVTCYGISDAFGVVKLGENEYKVVVTKSLNREISDSHDVTVVCQDSGLPPLNTSKKFTVIVRDENDNPPVFTKRVYFLTVEEDNEVSVVIGSVSASDIDIGQNAKVTYRLESERSNNFWLDPQNGEIRVNNVLDREMNAQITFGVIAFDGGIPVLSGSAIVVVNITDVNDNAPKFTEPLYETTIEENVPLGTTLSRLIATDPDNGVNGTVVFSYVSPLSEDFPFVLYSNGTIVTTNSLDREVKSWYEFTVMASDQGADPLSSSVQLVITIADQNDNFPVFIFPNKENNTVTVSYYAIPGSVIATVTANDLDAGRNSFLSYRIIDKNYTDIFSLDSITGVLRLMRHLKPSDYSEYILTMSSKDYGDPPLSTNETINIIISAASQTSEIMESSQNFVIAVTLGCITALLSLIIVVIIFIIKRRDKLKSTGTTLSYSSVTADRSNLTLVGEGENVKQGEFQHIEFRHKTKPEHGSSTDHGMHQISYPESTYKYLGSDPGSSGQIIGKTANTSFHSHELDTATILKLHNSILQSRGAATPRHGNDNTPPLSKKVRKFQEDIGSDSSGETNTFDSGRGGSELDIQCSAFSPSHVSPDNIKSVKFASQPLIYNISLNTTWDNLRNAVSTLNSSFPVSMETGMDNKYNGRRHSDKKDITSMNNIQRTRQNSTKKHKSSEHISLKTDDGESERHSNSPAPPRPPRLQRFNR